MCALRHERSSRRFSKSRGLSASVSFLPLPLPLFPLFGSRTIFRSEKHRKPVPRSFFAPTHGNACYAAYVFIGGRVEVQLTLGAIFFFLFFFPLRRVLYLFIFFFHQDAYKCFPFIIFLNISASIIIIRESDCSNWRGVTLLPITSKVFSKIIHTRLVETLDEHIRREQAGFRRGCSCSDHIFTLRQILEQSKEWNVPLYAYFIDFEKAFDSIHRHSLWKILRHYGIPSKLVNVIKMLYSDFKSQVICNAALIDAFSVTTGVKQGCILSPFLFILGIDWVMKQVTSGGRRGIR